MIMVRYFTGKSQSFTHKIFESSVFNFATLMSVHVLHISSPGKRGFYSPAQGRGTPERLNAFRNVGRLMGLCLLQNELCPLFFNRHVIKFLLSRKVRFHDLAFFDPVTAPIDNFAL